jgi:hypothetical protein
MNKEYIRFLRWCLQPSEQRPDVSKINWTNLLSFARKQCIVGIYWLGIEKLGDVDNKPNETEIMSWMEDVIKIKRQGQLLDRKVVELCRHFKDEGYEYCILKGQTNNRFYPEPYCRTPGDIDIWVNSTRKELLKVILSKYDNTIVCYHHLEYPYFKDTSVEAHIYPTFSTNPINNYRIQKFFASEAKRQMRNTIPLSIGQETVGLTDDVNILYQLMHMHRHMCEEGLGLRQLIDYFFLIKGSSLSVKDRERLVRRIKRFHLTKFAKGILYLLHTQLGMDKKYLFLPEDDKEGEYLLIQILQGGNFGKYNEIVQGYKKSPHWQRFPRRIAFFLSKWRHDPYEILWQPLFLSVNWFMQQLYKRRYNLH